MATRKLPDQAYLRECFDYDPETGILTWRARPAGHFPKPHSSVAYWNECHAGRRADLPFFNGRVIYHRVRLQRQSTYAHRAIWKLMTGDEPMDIDHRNGDGTDNRWANLRDATRQQNLRNSRVRTGRSLPKGVSKYGSRYAAHIRDDLQQLCLGIFATPGEAHAAYCEAAVSLHGEFANFGHY